MTDNRLAVVPATYVKLSTTVDGTLRVVLDIEPKNMADAIGLFSKPGAPVAVARLTDSAAVAADHDHPGLFRVGGVDQHLVGHFSTLWGGRRAKRPAQGARRGDATVHLIRG